MFSTALKLCQCSDAEKLINCTGVQICLAGSGWHPQSVIFHFLSCVLPIFPFRFVGVTLGYLSQTLTRYMLALTNFFSIVPKIDITGSDASLSLLWLLNPKLWHSESKSVPAVQFSQLRFSENVSFGACAVQQ